MVLRKLHSKLHGKIMPYVSIRILYVTDLNNTGFHFSDRVIISFCYPGNLSFFGFWKQCNHILR